QFRDRSAISANLLNQSPQFCPFGRHHSTTLQRFALNRYHGDCLQNGRIVLLVQASSSSSGFVSGHVFLYFSRTQSGYRTPPPFPKTSSHHLIPAFSRRTANFPRSSEW